MEPGQWVTVKAENAKAFRDGHVGVVDAVFLPSDRPEIQGLPEMAWVKFPSAIGGSLRSPFKLTELIPTTAPEATTDEPIERAVCRPEPVVEPSRVPSPKPDKPKPGRKKKHASNHRSFAFD